MRYLDKNKDLDLIFKVVYDIYDKDKNDKVADYGAEINGVKKFGGVLDMVKTAYYPFLFDKTAYLLITINKGHFFSNGNKRLSLATAILFLLLNNHWVYNYKKERYDKKIKEIFPEYDNLKNYKEFDSMNFAFYNLSLIIADSNLHKVSLDDLKDRVNNFIQYSTFKFKTKVK